jgi:cell division protein FtsB
MKNSNFNWKYLAAFAALVALFFLLMDLNTRQTNLTRLNEELSSMQTEVSGLNSTQDALNTSIVYSTSEAAVDEYARENDMIQKGEKLIVPLNEGTPQAPQFVQPTSAPQQISNSDIWWALFFGK